MVLYHSGFLSGWYFSEGGLPPSWKTRVQAVMSSLIHSACLALLDQDPEPLPAPTCAVAQMNEYPLGDQVALFDFLLHLFLRLILMPLRVTVFGIDIANHHHLTSLL